MAGFPSRAARIVTTRYVAFAILAGVLNLLSQRAVMALYDGPLAVATALVVGTGVGLVAKFILDKFWIFEDRAAATLTDHGRQFGLYALSGAVTTTIFWGMELLSWTIFRTHRAALAGGTAGLAIGYAVKYRLDRRFVFRRRS